MNKALSFKEFLATQSVQVPIVNFIINLVIAGLLAWVLGKIYVRYGTSLSNRRQFGRNFVVLAMTTMFIISVVKSSLALSLGLVGALSIVRFRAAIKEPEELLYLFLCIAIGLGLGADQLAITLATFVIMVIAIVFRHAHHKGEDGQNLHLTISMEDPSSTDIDNIVGVVKRHCEGLSLKRLDKSQKHVELALHIDFANFGQLKNCESAIRELHPSARVTFLDVNGLG